MIISENVEQGSDEWFSLRKGRATASQFKSILTPGGKISKSSQGYIQKLVRECVIDDPMEFIGNKFTDWGNDMEEEARLFFAKKMRLTGDEVGFVNRADGAPIGCSPDWMIHPTEKVSSKYSSGLEIKCPQVDKHVSHVREGVLPDEYKLQVHGSMAVTGLPYWYFMSYFPCLNPLIIKVERDEFTDKVTAALDEFVIDYGSQRDEILDAIIPK
jgi:hypothetical protein